MFCCSGLASFGQTRDLEVREQLWIGYFNQTRLTARSGIWSDLHLRLTNDFVKDLSLSILRLGYTYYLADNVRLTAGYSFVTQYSTVTQDIPEHRPWQQVQWTDKRARFSMAQYLRVEERFRRKTAAGELIDGHNFNWRFRYQMALTIPLKGTVVAPGIPFLFISDEIMINAGDKILINTFDQNRFFIGPGFQFKPGLNAHLGYLYVYQQLPEVNKFVAIHGIRLFVFQQLDLRRSR